MRTALRRVNRGVDGMSAPARSLQVTTSRFHLSILDLMIAVAFIACYCTIWTFLLMALVVHVSALSPLLWMYDIEPKPIARSAFARLLLGRIVSAWAMCNWLILILVFAFAIWIGVLSIACATILGGIWLYFCTIVWLRDWHRRRIARTCTSSDPPKN